MDFGVHLPLMRFATEELSFRRLAETVDAARECGFAAVSAKITSSSRLPGSMDRRRWRACSSAPAT